MKDSVFLKACRREKTPYTPVWLMRQAGRYQKFYRAIRKETPFLDLCKNPELAARVTVQARQELGTDAAILFSDILLIVEPMGFSLAYLQGDGPSIGPAIRRPADLDRIREFRAGKDLAFVGEAVRLSRKQLDSSVALIGFAGAPFTVASYMIEGGAAKDFSKTKHFFQTEPDAWGKLLEKIADFTAEYLCFQIDCGADAVQLFDSWAGVLSPEEYRRYAAPFSKWVFERIGSRVPTLHFGTKTGPFLEDFAAAGGSVVGVDHRLPLQEAWRRIGNDRAIQGNMDSEILCRGDRSAIEREVRRVLTQAAGRPGHIFNLGHGVLPETPEENVKMVVEMVHEFSVRL